MGDRSGDLTEVTIVIVLIVTLLVGLAFGMPIALALLLASAIHVLTDPSVSILILPQQWAVGADNMVLLALPFFLLAGELMNAAGITDRLTRLALAILGPLPGGLAVVVVIANVLVAMVSGAAVASAAAVGSTMVPMMTRRGYSAADAAAINAAAATIGPVIPPSIGFIIYASVSGASVGRLFLAGTLPGLLIATLIIAVALAMAIRGDAPAGDRHQWSEMRAALLGALPGLLMPVLILGGIFGGWVTPTEAGVLAVIYGGFVGLFVYRSLTWQDLPAILTNATHRSASILIIIAAASLYGFLLTRQVDGPAMVQTISGLTQSPAVLLLLIVGVVVLLGTIMEGGSLMIILTPLLLPLLAAYQIDVVHFGVLFQLAIMVGLLTPPVGILLFVVARVADVPVRQLVGRLWPYYGVLAIVTLAVTFFPALAWCE